MRNCPNFSQSCVLRVFTWAERGTTDWLFHRSELRAEALESTSQNQSSNIECFISYYTDLLSQRHLVKGFFPPLHSSNRTVTESFSRFTLQSGSSTVAALWMLSSTKKQINANRTPAMQPVASAPTLHQLLSPKRFPKCNLTLARNLRFSKRQTLPPSAPQMKEKRWNSGVALCCSPQTSNQLQAVWSSYGGWTGNSLSPSHAREGLGFLMCWCAARHFSSHSKQRHFNLCY